MRTLEWADVDDDAGVIRLRSEHSKNGESRILPIRGELAEVIARRSALRPLETRRVFHFQGRALRGPALFLEKATAGICRPNLLVHDLRCTAVRDMVRAGVPLTVAMRISSHKSMSGFIRYDIVSEDDLVDALGKRDQYQLVCTVRSRAASRLRTFPRSANVWMKI